MRRFVFLCLALFVFGAAAAEPGQAYAELKTLAAPRPLPAGAVTADWPHFLGPTFNATTPESALLDRWPAAGPARVWSLAKGDGYAGPSVAAGRLVFFHRIAGRETVDCLDPETGRRYWRFDYAADYEDRYGFSPGPRAAPVIAGGRVTVAGVTARLHCLDLATGRVLWQRDLAKEFAVPQYFFGYGPSPFVWRDRVIVNVGGKAVAGERGTCVAAFDAVTGRTLWEVEDSWGADYASPLVATLHGRDVALVMAGGESRPSAGGLLVVDPADGRVLERFPWRARAYESVLAATPRVIGGTQVLISETYDKGAALLAFDEALKAKPVWTQRGFGLHWMVPLERDGHLYGFAGRNPPDTEFKCVDLATGKIVWHDDTQFTEGGRTQSFFRGSLLQAGERIFALGEDGLLGEFGLTPRGPELRQRVRLFAAQSAWTLPVLHRGLLYVMQNERDARAGTPPQLICYDLRGE
jgi:outer membrane protein assembly factor BamB